VSRFLALQVRGCAPRTAARVLERLRHAVAVHGGARPEALALGLVDLVTCMFEGRVLVEQSPDDIRRNKQVQEVYLGRPRHA